jgi:DNA-binding CsgD family transcriptional regulator
VHLWIIHTRRPGQTRSWYLRSCKFHLMHYLAAGRSIDSFRLHGGQWESHGETEDLADFPTQSDPGGSVLSIVSAHDLVSVLYPHLSQPERNVLDCCAEGLGTREIGRRLHISHTMVTRHRHRIASLLAKLEKPAALGPCLPPGATKLRPHPPLCACRLNSRLAQNT